MASLYNPPSSGDFTPYIKYNAKAGRWYVKKDGTDVEVQTPTFCADFSTVKKAWMHFMEGQAPDVVYYDSFDQVVPSPSPNHKLGISLRLFAKSLGGVVKLESNSINTCKAINALFEQYLAGEAQNKGKLPIVKVTGANPIKGNYGTNYEPVFVIEKWVPRPAEFDAEAPAPAPAPQAAPTPAVTSDDDWG